MREPLVGSLIFGDHKIPGKRRPWTERLKMPAAVGLVFVIILVLSYEFWNYREQRAVTGFLNDVMNGRLDAAFSMWDVEGSSYTMQDFTADWGKDGYYTKGVTSAKVIDSNSRGQSVIVYVSIDTFRVPLALLVDKGTLKLSYSPSNKYKARVSQ